MGRIVDEQVTSSTGVDFRAPRILVCDDSPDERTALDLYLRANGYETRTASGGQMALDTLKEHEFDLILLDLHMPGTSGFDVLAYLQKHRRGLPVIIMSGLPADQIQTNIHALPHHELPPLLLKPIDPDQLLPLMELILREQLPDFETPPDVQSETEIK